MTDDGTMNGATGPLAPPSANPVRGGDWDGCLVGCLGRPLIILGGGLLLLWLLSCVFDLANPDIAREEELLRRMTVTPLRSLVNRSDAVPGAARSLPFHDGDLIRVEGFLRADVPIAAFRAPDDRYALQYLEIMHKQSRGGEDLTTYDVTDATVYYYPPHLWLDVDREDADAGGVEVKVPEGMSGYRLRLQPASAMVDQPGTIPAAVAGALFQTDIPPENEQIWTLWAIRQHTRVTVLALAHLREGRVVLELNEKHWCAVSPDEWSDIIEGGYPPLWLYGVVGSLLVLLPVPWHYWKRRRNRQA